MKYKIFTFGVLLTIINAFSSDWYKMELNASRTLIEYNDEYNLFSKDSIIDTFTHQGMLMYHNNF